MFKIVEYLDEEMQAKNYYKEKFVEKKGYVRAQTKEKMLQQHKVTQGRKDKVRK